VGAKVVSAIVSLASDAVVGAIEVSAIVSFAS
jgi:hypothetical protein